MSSTTPMEAITVVERYPKKSGNELRRYKPINSLSTDALGTKFESIRVSPHAPETKRF